MLVLRLRNAVHTRRSAQPGLARMPTGGASPPPGHRRSPHGSDSTAAIVNGIWSLVAKGLSKRLPHEVNARQVLVMASDLREAVTVYPGYRLSFLRSLCTFCLRPVDEAGCGAVPRTKRKTTLPSCRIAGASMVTRRQTSPRTAMSIVTILSARVRILQLTTHSYLSTCCLKPCLRLPRRFRLLPTHH